MSQQLRLLQNRVNSVINRSIDDNCSDAENDEADCINARAFSLDERKYGKTKLVAAKVRNP